jgi:hypothetical protein
MGQPGRAGGVTGAFPVIIGSWLLSCRVSTAVRR